MADENMEMLRLRAKAKMRQEQEKTAPAAAASDAEAPDTRGMGTKVLQGVVKGLDDLSGAAPLRAALARTLGTHSGKEVGQMLNPLSPTTIPSRDILEKAGVPKGPEFGGISYEDNPYLKKMNENAGFPLIPEQPPTNLRNVAGNAIDFISPIAIAKGAGKLVDKLKDSMPALTKYLSEANDNANGVQGASKLEKVMNPLNKVDEMNKNRLAGKADSLYQKAFKYPQLRIDTSTTLDKAEMLPLWEQAKSSGFKGTMSDFMDTLENNAGKAGKDIGEIYKANPTAQVKQAPVLDLLDSKAKELSTSLAPTLHGEAAPVMNQANSIRDRLGALGTPELGPAKPILRPNPEYPGRSTFVGEEPLNVVPSETLPLPEAVKLYQDINKGKVNYNKPMGTADAPSESVLKQAVRMEKNQIQEALPEVDYENLMNANKRLFSSDSSIQKEIAPFARLKSEDPANFTNVDKLYTAHGPGASLARGDYKEAAVKAAALLWKKKGDYQKATSSMTGRAADALGAAQTPVNATQNLMKQAALIEYLNSLKGDKNGTNEGQ